MRMRVSGLLLLCGNLTCTVAVGQASPSPNTAMAPPGASMTITSPPPPVAGATTQPEDVVPTSESSDTSPLKQGPYISPMLSYIMPVTRSRLDDGYGGAFSAGYRWEYSAIEATGVYDMMGGDGNPKYVGGSINGLLFPFKSLSNFYGKIGFGGLEVRDYATNQGRSFSLTTVEGGLGYLFPFIGDTYNWALRVEALYRYGHRETRLNATEVDLDAPANYGDVVFNLGLWLPLGKKAPVVAPAPATVVPLAPACSDGVDNDGDGKIDFPADAGCTAADDNDETDPAMCSDGKDNDGDGLVDFPADKGCTSADDNDETDPCKTPLAGERVTLSGCGTGDIIVLRGVNFDFDKATLTANAKTILDNVGDELIANPQINVELSGHTDSKGADVYNLKLSDRRAKSVVAYLVAKGIVAERMTAVGYGETQPVADNDTDEGRELNRRVELKVTGSRAAVAAAPTSTPAPSSTTESPPVADPFAVTP
ncbi:MAG: hypothetical protein JWQ90_4791 [Hydrocarboniphaga sp.]|uniref:OmpA family protein n=1 Tax=Hydrocarboniphaga sp. TaxID=2033016 RepID=UPI00261A9271|nr:OmpA family protein [Hydrocarboniphaga sp.]MDB5972341.1 hypothetical protein [Hydrocarboniphaga sp.]